MPPPRVGFLHRFGPKTGIDFTNCRLNSGMVFEGIRGYMNLAVLIPNEWRKKEQLKEYSNHVRKIR